MVYRSWTIGRIIKNCAYLKNGNGENNLRLARNQGTKICFPENFFSKISGCIETPIKYETAPNLLRIGIFTRSELEYTIYKQKYFERGLIGTWDVKVFVQS